MQQPRYPIVYLAGAIRDDHDEDIVWREEAIDRLGLKATILNPLGGKTRDSKTGAWFMSSIPAVSKSIVKQDFWCVDRADIVIANLLSMSEGYPSIGTMMELGRASGTNALIYVIVDPDYKGHKNPGIFRAHPFIEQIAGATFENVEDCMRFTEQHLDVLNGTNSRFRGIV
jgi:nucleoside 2-deoxyribosyltransferase